MIDLVIELVGPFLMSLIFSYYFINYTSEIDFEHIKKKEYIDDHTSRFRQRFFVGMIILIVAPIMALGFGLLFWALFDSSLSVKRGFSIYYIGEKANTDNWFSDKPLLFKWSKWVSLALSIPLYFLHFYINYK